MSTPAKVAARQLVDRAGRLPDHLVQSLARQLATKARTDASSGRRVPA